MNLADLRGRQGAIPDEIARTSGIVAEEARLPAANRSDVTMGAAFTVVSDVRVLGHRSHRREAQTKKGRQICSGMVPLAGIEPALLAELDFESSASTNSATGAPCGRPDYSDRRCPVNLSRRSKNAPGAHGRAAGLTLDHVVFGRRRPNTT